MAAHLSQVDEAELQALVEDRKRLKLVQEQLTQAKEELDRLKRAKSQIVSMAVHDFRTPLAAMQGYVDLCLESLETGAADELKDFLPAIQTQVDRLQHLVGDFLDLDLIGQGKLNVYPMTCVLADVVCDLAGNLGEFANRQKLRLVLELEEHVRVMADPARLRQAMYNLLYTAVKYSAEGGEICIRTWADEQTGYLRVRDQGPAIGSQDIANLFDLPDYPNGTMSSRARGSGVGLHLAKVLIEAQGGQIQVSSEPGEGASFTIGLPLAGTANSGI